MTSFRPCSKDVESIEEYTRLHPLSTEAAVASLKRYLPNRITGYSSWIL